MRRRTKVKMGVAAVIGVLFLLGELLFGLFSGTEICPQCGQLRDVWHWHVPMRPDLPLFITHQHYRPTPVGEALAECDLVSKNHTHRWLFCQGGEEGMCALGKGRYTREVDSSPAVADLVRAASRHGDKEVLETFLKVLATETPTSDIHWLVSRLAAGIGPGEVNDARRYRQWLNEKSDALERLRKPPVEEP